MPVSTLSSDESESESDYDADDIPEKPDDNDEEYLREGPSNDQELAGLARRPQKSHLPSNRQLPKKNATEKERGKCRRKKVVVRAKGGERLLLPSVSKAHLYTAIPRAQITLLCDAGGGYYRVKRTRYYISWGDGLQGEEDDIDKFPTKKKRAAPFKLKRFDVSTLLPLNRVEKSTQKDPFKIELICTLTGEVHACFPNVEYAAQALNVEPAVIRKACRFFGDESFQIDENLPYCQLRYVQQSATYEYGAHARDFFSCEETHEERLERWAKLQKTETSHQPPKPSIGPEGERSSEEGVKGSTKDSATNSPKLSGRKRKETEKRKGSEQQAPHHQEEEGVKGSTKGSGTNSPKLSGRKRKETEKRKGSEQQASHHQESDEDGGGNVSDGNNNSEEKCRKKNGKQKLEKAISRPSEAQIRKIMPFLEGATVMRVSDTFYSTCVACQENDSSIVLEPCHHCVLCRSCAEKWCPYVCPRCLTPIRRRVQPAQCTWIQPHVHSKYSFL
jgi:hypothetical protein